jgi:enamine deaminase RidA (YjgF/YER057c/UK114 family)
MFSLCGDTIMVKHLPVLAVALIGPLTAAAQERKQIPLPPAQGVIPNMSGAVWAGNLLFVSGWLDPDLEKHSDTKSQTEGIYKDLQKFLESQNLTLGDVVMIHAYIGSEAGRVGYRAGYDEFFGPDQPNKPAHTLLENVLPAAGRGALVEVDIIAVRPGSGPSRISPS